MVCLAIHVVVIPLLDFFLMDFVPWEFLGSIAFVGVIEFGEVPSGKRILLSPRRS